MEKLRTNLYGILGAGLALSFLGHGILATKGNEKFVALVTGTDKEILGGNMSTDTATTIVNVIGYFDVTLAVALLGLVVAAFAGHRIAYSPLAIALFGWGVIWGFLTALSRLTAVMDLAEVWDVVERGPNFMLPAALLYIVLAARRERAAKEAPARDDGRAVYTGTRPVATAR